MVSVTPHAGAQSFGKAVDRRPYTPRKAGTSYLDVVLAKYRLYAMRDTGANFSMITRPMAKALGLEVLPYQG